MKTRVVRCLALTLFATTVSAWAIDNPDAPDLVGGFNQRAQRYERAIQQDAKTTQDTLKAYADYERFLDQELNTAYQSLLSKLSAPEAAKARDAQRKWLQYRDAEFGFIAENWTADHFGSSAVLSRGAYRTTVIRDRITSLLNYLKNY